MLFTNRDYTIHDQESFRKSEFLYSALQSPIHGYHVLDQRENTGSRLFTEVKPCWTGLLSGWVTKSTASDIEISSLLILRNIFEFINILWSLIFLKSIRCILEVQQDR